VKISKSRNPDILMKTDSDFSEMSGKEEMQKAL
jgi:hypothetical protein